MEHQCHVRGGYDYDMTRQHRNQSCKIDLIQIETHWIDIIKIEYGSSILYECKIDFLFLNKRYCCNQRFGGVWHTELVCQQDR